jgi:hypothetical protein
MSPIIAFFLCYAKSTLPLLDELKSKAGVEGGRRSREEKLKVKVKEEVKS